MSSYNDFNLEKVASWGVAIAGLFLAVYQLYKKDKKVELSFFVTNVFSLFHNGIKNMQSISVRFKNEEIKNNLLFSRVIVGNSGSIDIEKSAIERPMEISVSPRFKILDCFIVEKSEGLECSIGLDNNKIAIDHGLFRVNEYIFLELYFEDEIGLEKSEYFKFHEELSIDHRIANMPQSVVRDSFSFPPKTNSKFTTKYWYLFIFTTIIFLTGLYYFSFDTLTIKPIFNKSRELPNNKYIGLYSNDTTLVKAVSLSELNQMLVDQHGFLSVRNLSYSKDNLYVMIPIFIFLVYYIIAFYIETKDGQRYNRFRRFMYYLYKYPPGHSS